GAEGRDARQLRARRLVQLEHRAAGARYVDEGAGQRGMEHRLPERAAEVGAERLGLPIALEAPFLHEVTALPLQPLFVPDLRVPVRDIRKDAALELHVDIVAVEQRYLVM